LELIKKMSSNSRQDQSAHYDEVDIMVLLGRMKKTEAAAELEMNYDAYCKSLHRKNLSFQIIATKAGHC